jgi:HPt (histidine-containing phosphotransfer) domain-containing protein
MTQQDAPEAGAVLDLAPALENLDHDAELLREICDLLLETAPQQLEELESFLAAGDVEAVATAAHGMKGGASNVGATAFVHAARELELLAKGGSLQGAEELLSAMQREFERVRDALAAVDWEDPIPA